jgi:subtilisin family serine protease
MDDQFESSFVETPKQVAVIDSGYARDNAKLHNYLDTSDGLYARMSSIGDMTNSALLNESIITAPYMMDLGKKSSHGTHVAGIAALAYGDVSKVTPDETFKPVVPIKISLNHTETQNFIDALNYLKDNPNIAVINLSWSFGGKTGSIPLNSALEQAMTEVMEAGKIIVLSAGNNSALYNTDPYTRSLFKLAKKSKGRLIIVGASQLKNGKEQMANFSAISDPQMAPYFVTAPGVEIESFAPLSINPTGKDIKSGTSMAAPLVAGTLTRLITDFPSLTIDEVSEIFRSTARKQYKDNGQVFNRFGCGIINIKAARKVAIQKTLEKNTTKKPQQPFIKKAQKVAAAAIPPTVQVPSMPVRSQGWTEKALNAVYTVAKTVKSTATTAISYVKSRFWR